MSAVTRTVWSMSRRARTTKPRQPPHFRSGTWKRCMVGISIRLGPGLSGPCHRGKVKHRIPHGSQQQPAGSATFSGAFAGPHPQPDLPSALASASATQQASTCCRGGTAAASRRCRRTIDRKVGRAHARLRQDEVDVVRCGDVAGDGRHDRADLLVAGQHQEGRRPPVALDADGVEARLGMGELAVAVRRHRSAGVQVRVDQRPERLRALQPRVEVEPQLAGQVQVRALSGRDDDPVDGADLADAVCRLALDHDLPADGAARG